MIFRHTRTNVLYRKISDSFSVERQAASVVYVSLETGAIFDRDAARFAENFTPHRDAQSEIVAKAPA